MHWTRLERTIATKLILYPRSTTPRERTMLLFAIRLALVGVALPVLGLAMVSVGGIVQCYHLTVAGSALLAAGLVLLVLAMAAGTCCLTIIYGD